MKTGRRKKSESAANRKKSGVARYLSFELREFQKFANPERFRSFFFIALILMAALPALAFGSYVYTWIVYGKMASQSEAGNGFVYLGAVGYFRIFLILGFVMIAGVLLYLLIFSRSAALKELARREPWHFLLLFLLLWSVPGLLLSEDPAVAWTGSPLQYDGLRTYLIIAAVYLSAWFLPGKERRLVVLRVFTGACNFCTVLMFGQLYRWPVVYDSLFHTPCSVTVNLNHFGYLLCTSIALLAGLFLYDCGKKRTIWYGASFAFQVLGLLFNDTFGCYLASVFALGTLFLFHWRSRRGWTAVRRRAAVLAAVFCLLSLSFYFNVIPSPTGRKFANNFSSLSNDVSSLAEGEEFSLENGGSGRMVLWKRALALIPEHPLVGFGPNGIPESYSLETGLTRPHNSFIQIAVLHGIPGVAAYIAALLLLLVRKWKELEKLDDSVLISAAGTAAFLASSFFGVPMFYSSPYLFLLLGFDATPERVSPLQEENSEPVPKAEQVSGVQSDLSEDTPSLSGGSGEKLIHWKRLVPLIVCILAAAGIAAFILELQLEKKWEEQDILFMQLACIEGSKALESETLSEPTRLWYEPEEGVLVPEPVSPGYGAGTVLRGSPDNEIEDWPALYEPYDIGADYSGKILEVEIDPQDGENGIFVHWVPAG